MRVERATLGKSITDGWLELRLLKIVYSSSRTWEYICVLKFKSLNFFLVMSVLMSTIWV